MIEVKIDISQLILGLRLKKQQIAKALISGLKMGVRLYESHIIVNQMSGRKRPDYGLKAPTGTLRRSWRVQATGANLEDYTVALSTSSKYARIHQFGGMAGRKRMTQIPKRLYIIEEFATVGKRLISQQLATRLRVEAQRV